MKPIFPVPVLAERQSSYVGGEAREYVSASWQTRAQSLAEIKVIKV